MSKDVRSEVVKNLADIYRKTAEQLYLCQILKRIDPLLVSHIGKLRSRKKHLKDIQLSELYNCAIVGLEIAIQESFDGESPERLQQRILNSVSLQIRTCYPKRKEFLVEGVPEIPVYDDPVEFDEKPVDIIAFLSKLIKDKVITKDEFILLCRRVLENVSYESLGKEFNVSSMTMLRRIRKIFARIVAFNESLRDSGEQSIDMKEL
jgi:hypothetical protein